MTDRAALAVVDAAYKLDGSIDAWMQGVLDAARPALDHGLGLMGLRFRLLEPTKLRIASSSIRTGSFPGRYDELFREATEALPPAIIKRVWGHPVALETGSTAFERISVGMRLADSPMMDWSRNVGVHDNLVAKMVDADGSGCMICAPLPSVRAVEPKREARWRHVMTHVLAGLRLRTALRQDEAILDPGGPVLHAQGEARRTTVREALRTAAVTIDRARTRMGERDPDGVLRAWRGLVCGRWSLVDRFDRDGRRYLVARPNEPSLAQPRSLTPRQRQVICYAALGYTNKRIAYALGLATSTISSHLREAMIRLRVRSVAELAEIALPGPREDHESA